METIKLLLLVVLLTCLLSCITEGKRKRTSRSNVGFDLLPDERMCQRKRCGRRPKGSWCQVVVDNNGRRQATCVCPTSCNVTDISPVCSVFGRQYDNECLLHKEGCRKKKNIKIAYKGACIASQAKCRSDEMEQFPFRLLDWFVHLKDSDEFGTVDPRRSVTTISKTEMQDVAQWKFQELDRNQDGKVNNRELKRFRFALMPMEHCAKEFFKKCDTVKNKKLTRDEWRSCLVGGAWEWLQRRNEADARRSAGAATSEVTIQ